MRNRVTICVVFALLVIAGCSLAPERLITRQELYKTQVFSEFKIKDSPESVLAILNREGEAVLEGENRLGEPYYIKLLATQSGVKVRLYAK